MTENIPPQPPPSSAPTAAADVPGQPFYERTRLHLKDLLHKKRQLERSLAATEETILNKETEYLEDTPAGNIIIGFENYTKNVGVGGGGRRGRGAGDGEGGRVFTRSSVSFRGGEVGSSSIISVERRKGVADGLLRSKLGKD
jgi:chromatin modification-related protein EAF6